MYVKIYFGGRPLYLTDHIDAGLNNLVHHDDSVFIDEFSTPGINSMIHEMRQPRVHAGIMLHNDLAALQKAFFKKFQLVKAAGGLVFNSREEVLIIYRRGKWDLPKGKLDAGESLEQCAVREVKEETGLSKLAVREFLLSTYHIYDESGKHLLKESHWYSMQSIGPDELIPQKEEDIEQALWVDPARLPEYAAATYPSIRDVWQKAGFL